jgi:hypothetical protein
MTGAPQRVQLRRTPGYRKPAGAIVVARPGRWGNPFRIGEQHPFAGRPMTRDDTIQLFRSWMTDVVLAAEPFLDNPDRDSIEVLRGHDLACWCPLDEPCHADVLLELANRPVASARDQDID